MALDNAFNSAVQNISYASADLLAKYNATTDKRFGIYFQKMAANIKSSKEAVQISEFLSELQNCIL
ncbi:hypothetical protein [Chryseobacterium indoltheticum]|uniref:hypothetical protein n=1 Tax=Chryseobacterium indoltheticum TaxID=254 RepID=UPI003F498251